MITAKQAYENYSKWKNYLPIEMFVNSVFERVITDERIAKKTVFETDINFSLSTIFEKVFSSEEWDSPQNYTRWSVNYARLPDELYGKQNSEIISELDQMYETSPEDSFICKVVKALVFELEVVAALRSNWI